MRTTWMVLAALPLTGCLVTQGTYDALQAELDSTKSTLQSEQGKSATLAQAMAAKSADDERCHTDLAATAKAKADLEGQLAAASSDKSHLQETLADLAKRKAEADARVAEFKALLDRFKAFIDSGKLKVKMVEGKMVLSLASDILFASGSASLSKDGKTAIKEVAGLLASIPEKKFQIEGHTDNVPFNGRSNWDLGSSRALTVLKTMVEAGMPENRISAASYGDSQPAQPNDTPEGKAANRRIEIVVVPDLSALPGFEELNRVQSGPSPAS